MKVFLSCVTREFGSYRQRVAAQLAALPRQTFEVKVQEDFQQGSFTLLEQIGAYIRECDLVLHLVGDSSGERPSPEHVQAMFAKLGEATPTPLPELSYTHWEYNLGLRFGKRMFCYVAAPEAERDSGPKTQEPEAELSMQIAHRERIRRDGKDYRRFQGRHDLVRRIFFDLGLSPTDKAGNLPFASIGRLFKGRDEFVLKLRETLDEARHGGGIRAHGPGVPAAVVHGLGGVGRRGLRLNLPIDTRTSIRPLSSYPQTPRPRWRRIWRCCVARQCSIWPRKRTTRPRDRWRRYYAG